MKVLIIEKPDGKSFVIDVSEFAFRDSVTPDMKLGQNERIEKIVDEFVKDVAILFGHKLKMELRKLK